MNTINISMVAQTEAPLNLARNNEMIGQEYLDELARAEALGV
jgi:hypothetical protein